jgi:hypothetical protein
MQLMQSEAHLMLFNFLLDAALTFSGRMVANLKNRKIPSVGDINRC